MYLLRPVFLRYCFYIALFLFSISIRAQAQKNYQIEGTVKDTVNFAYTQYTSVSLIRASDSILLSFTRADETGHFVLQTDSPGKYILLFENPQFASYVDRIKVSGRETNLGLIAMMSRKTVLQNIVINGQQPITVKGDTVVYTADSFHTGRYDNVDALLKKLPGLEVNSDGSIKAYGKTVQKMLVDGEEFFSDDPAMVAKMLRASSVDKVQVYDDKTDKAKFTGIDDGKKIKTINLKLKDNAKRGYFGKVGLGGGLPDYWQEEAMINAFKKKRKLSAYAIMSNTETGGLGFSDSRQYGSGNGRVVSSSGGVVFTSYANSGSDNYGYDGNYSGQGLPKTWTGGLHYNNSWWGDTLSLNASYNFRKNAVASLNNTVTKYILPDTQYLNNYQSVSAQSNLNHNLSLRTEYKPDSLSTFSLRVNGSAGTNHSTTNENSEARTLGGALINRNKKTQTGDGQNNQLNAYLRYRRKFRKKGRSFSASLSGNWNHSKNDGHLFSKYKLFTIDSTHQIDQRKHNENDNRTASLSLNYTEPVSKSVDLLFDYNLNLNNQESYLQSFNSLPGNMGDYDQLDSLYSSHYIYQVLSNRGGMRLMFHHKKKFYLTIGGDISHTHYTQKDIMGDSVIRYSYLNFFPSVSIRFQKNRMTNISLYYNGNSQQPSINQLQPVRNNEDPLNVAIGNPDLKQAFLHQLRLQYYNFKVMSGQSIFLTASFNYTQDAITQKQNIDLTGRRTYQYVNVNGNYDAGFWGSFGRKIYKTLRGSIGMNLSYNRTHNFINNQANRNNTWGLGPNIRLYYHLDTILEISYSFQPYYNSTIAEIRSDVKTQYWNFHQSLTTSVELPFHFKLGTAVEWYIRQQLSATDEHNKVFLWNAWLSRSFLKDRSLVLKLYANDILNQNVGYSRVTMASQISESNYNTISRYLMLSLTWNFTKTGSPGGE